VSSDQERFYDAFIKQFKKLFGPQVPPYEAHQCPFGPNYGSNSWTTICSLEGPYQEHSVGVTGGPWDGPQRAFFIPPHHIDETWKWSQENKGLMDVLKHPNTGCMHDDHSKRALWDDTLRDKCDLPDTGCAADCSVLVKKYPCADYYAPGKKFAGDCDKTCGFNASSPNIKILEFPCNMPGTGCNDSIFKGPPRCGCSTPLPSDDPKYSCKGCINSYVPPKRN
jgi:hypothetical protein